MRARPPLAPRALGTQRASRRRQQRTIAAALLGVVLVGCQTSDERADHGVCGDSADAVCPEDDDETTEETSALPTDDQAPIDCSGTAEADFPTVVDAALEPAGDGAYTVSATLCSAYDTPQRYADAWRVTTPAGEVLGVRELLHDHGGEQPFTRSLSEPVEVPADVDELVVEGRDLDNGWGGKTLTVTVPDE